jgi:hypothetical protein
MVEKLSASDEVVGGRFWALHLEPFIVGAVKTRCGYGFRGIRPDAIRLLFIGGFWKLWWEVSIEIITAVLLAGFL